MVIKNTPKSDLENKGVVSCQSTKKKDCRRKYEADVKTIYILDQNKYLHGRQPSQVFNDYIKLGSIIEAVLPSELTEELIDAVKTNSVNIEHIKKVADTISKNLTFFKLPPI